MDSIDRAVAALASRQYGRVSAAQCLALGATRHQVKSRLQTGRWHEIHRGVYAIGHTAHTHHAGYMAAVLATNAVLSHRSAASLWALQSHHGGLVHVLSAKKKRARRGIVIHWTRALSPTECVRRSGIPVTSLARTLADLLATAPPDEAELAIRAAERIHGFDRSVLRRRTITLTRGELERLFLRVLDEADLQRPVMNHPWGDYELDGYWPAQGLVVEIDDFETHGNRTAFARDRRRDRALTIAGLTPIRITHDDLMTGRAALLTELRALGVPQSG
jgi:very-short-patch-repair endonuclease